VKLESLRPSIIILLKRCLYDNDDEVRDRATFYLNVLDKQMDIASKLLTGDFKVPIVNLEQSLQDYQKNPSLTPFDLSTVSLVVTTQREAPKKGQSGKTQATPTAAPTTAKPEASEIYAQQLASIPQFVNLGAPFKSSKAVELTESETEYVVNCVKHVFQNNIVLQFNCTNTLNEQLLENIQVKVDVSGVKDVTVDSIVPLQSLPCGTPGATYVCLKIPGGSPITGTFPTTLKFIAKDVDPQSGEAEDNGYEDEYQLEDLEVTTADYMQLTFVPDFNQKWEELGDEFEVIETYALSTMKSLQAAVKEITEFLGMQPCERSDKVPAKKSKHILLLSGNFYGNISVLVRGRMKFVEGQGVQMELTVRSTSDDVSTLVASAI